MSPNFVSIGDAANVIKQGGVVAYPTESCYGLGCDPQNTQAIQRILNIKRRSKDKGLIIISDEISKIERYVDCFPDVSYDEMIASWPGPFTWLLPAKSDVSTWLKGSHETLAIRVTGHKTASLLCKHSEMAIVSTSANRANQPSIRTMEDVAAQIGSEIDCISEGEIGDNHNPSVIRDARSGMVVRG